MKLPFEPRHFTTLLLLALILFLTGTIGTELGWGKRVNLPVPPPKPQKIRPAVLPLQSEFALRSLDKSYTEILARPLFVSSRRPLPPKFVPGQRSASSASTRRSLSLSPPPSLPLVPVVIEPPKPTMRKGQFILDGIIITKDKNIALLREVASRKMVRVELGQEINGMQVEKLERDKITFKQGDEHEEIILKIKTVPGPPGKSGSPHPAQLAAPAVPLPGAPVAAPEQNVGDPRSVFERRRALRQQPPE
ncbi:hypothetical protein [Candidatus Nitrotoga arctica]|uniref:Type II secretion system protein GspC N-terminal domain-containing protein n=1 Tax=Candidatus Nitrotoga arctica TaxID=453162 RepID=A0ABN8AF47_9PROT|nr:hypothetical protein [Candidatus Nitrotoga arctica]CAG9931370.1 conserved protein of unknown function [Candidatus Nitrotoga arctica]